MTDAVWAWSLFAFVFIGTAILTFVEWKPDQQWWAGVQRRRRIALVGRSLSAVGVLASMFPSVIAARAAALRFEEHMQRVQAELAGVGMSAEEAAERFRTLAKTGSTAE